MLNLHRNVVADHTISATFDHNSSGGGGTTRYTIKAEAQKGGSIFPSGRVRVDCGDDQTFRITADEGYEIEDVLVDGYSVGTVDTPLRIYAPAIPLKLYLKRKDKPQIRMKLGYPAG